MAGKNSKKVEQVEAPAKSGGASTLFVLILFVLVGIGCGVAFQHLIEKMEGSNAKLIGQISSLQEELASVKESYAAINFENEIASIGQMKEDLQQTRVQINAVESGLAAQISAATEAAVEAKQSAEESKTAAAGLHDQIEAAFGDDLELVKQNLASVIDARNAEAGKQAELAQQLAAAVSGSAEVSAQLATLQSGLNAVEKNTDDQGKALQEAVRSLESKANRLNANIKMTSNEVAGIKELVTNMVADNEPATEAPPMNEE